jgi:hypothetical protein
VVAAIFDTELVAVLSDGGTHEAGHRHIAQRGRGLRGSEDRPPVNDDHLLVNGDHPSLDARHIGSA